VAKDWQSVEIWRGNQVSWQHREVNPSNYRKSSNNLLIIP
jgi:hypothetical protein